MTVDWIAGAVRLDAGAQSGEQDLEYPPRLVLHTTEGGGTIESLAAFYKHSTYWPHFTADLLNKKLGQHIPLSRAGRALSHSDATETNGAHCIQVEIIGRAAESHTWTKPQVEWLGHALKEVLDALGIHRVGPRFVGAEESPAGEPRPQRMTNGQWTAFNGVCGHQHVPQNDHWDPGKLDLKTFLAATGVPTGDTVMPQYNPPITTEPIVAGLADPHGGAWTLAASGAIYAWGGARGCRGANGKVYFKGRKAARLAAPTSAEKAAGKLLAILDSTGSRYALPTNAA